MNPGHSLAEDEGVDVLKVPQASAGKMRMKQTVIAYMSAWLKIAENQ